MAGEQGLKCSVNYAGCKGKAKYICHHCGRLLCDGYNCCCWGWDPALAGWPIAYHCPACDDLPLVVKWARNAINYSNQLDDAVVDGLRRIRKMLRDRKKGKTFAKAGKPSDADSMADESARRRQQSEGGKHGNQTD
jgi:hypothetical protein